GINTRVDAIFVVGAAVEVLSEKRLALGMSDEVGMEGVELRRRDCAVVIPPHRRFGQRVADDEFVLGAAASVHTGLGNERAAIGEFGLARAQCMLVERGLGEIPVDGLEPGEPELFGAESAVANASFFHESVSSWAPGRKGGTLVGQPAPAKGVSNRNGNSGPK